MKELRIQWRKPSLEGDTEGFVIGDGQAINSRFFLPLWRSPLEIGKAVIS